MAFTAQDVKNLREMTGVGMMDCKKALTASDGDVDKAIEWLREKGLAAAQKKAGRIAAEGMAYAAIIDGVGVVVEVNAETDFVAKNEKFVDYVKGVAAVVAKEAPADLEALLAAPFGNGKTVVEQQQEMVLVIGENINVRRFARYDTGVNVPYIHAGGICRAERTDEAVPCRGRVDRFRFDASAADDAFRSEEHSAFLAESYQHAARSLLHDRTRGRLGSRHVSYPYPGHLGSFMFVRGDDICPAKDLRADFGVRRRIQHYRNTGIMRHARHRLVCFAVYL